MAWTDEMPLLLRIIINDLDSPEKYTDTRLEQLLLGSAQLIQSEISFRQKYMVDLTGLTITPDPTIANSHGFIDEGFVNLTVLKSACILARGGLAISAPAAISVTDGKKRIDTTKILEGAIALITNFCDAYEEARVQYLSGNGAAGRAIIGPYRVFMPYFYGDQPPFGVGLNRIIRGLYP
jgi:hypothetical protein